MTSAEIRKLAKRFYPEDGCFVCNHEVLKPVLKALLEYADLLENNKLLEYVDSLENNKQTCDDPECACHHPDGHHDKIENCPKCGGNGRVYQSFSGYYYVACTKCRHQLLRQEVTEYFAVLFWNKEAKKARKES